MSELLGLGLITELVKTTILTGRLKNDKPVSLLLIAPPERGKTSIVIEQPCKAVAVFSDVTGRGIQKICQQSPELSHIILTDLVAIMSHRDTVNRGTIAMLNAMTEEGIKATAYPNEITTYSEGMRGIIACLTVGLAKDGRAWWNKTGFSTRMLPFFYDHSMDLAVRIRASIVNGEYEKHPGKPKQFRIPARKINVTISKTSAEAIQHLANRAAELLGSEIGYRRGRQFRALARAHALLRAGWHAAPSVTKEDTGFLSRVMPYISYTKAETL